MIASVGTGHTGTAAAAKRATTHQAARTCPLQATRRRCRRSPTRRRGQTCRSKLTFARTRGGGRAAMHTDAMTPRSAHVFSRKGGIDMVAQPADGWCIRSDAPESAARTARRPACATRTDGAVLGLNGATAEQSVMRLQHEASARRERVALTSVRRGAWKLERLRSRTKPSCVYRSASRAGQGLVPPSQERARPLSSS